MAAQTSPIDEDSADAGILDLVDDLDAIVWEADPRTLNFVFVNRRGVEMLGYDLAEWYEPDFWAGRLIHPADRAVSVATCRAAVQELRDHQIEYRALTADGRIIWLRDIIRVLLDESGAVRTLRGVMIDVTAEREMAAALDAERAEMVALAQEREAAIEALRASEARYRRLVQTSPYAVFVVDAQGRVTEVNEAVLPLTGLTPEQIIGSPFEGFVAPAALDTVRADIAALLSGEVDRLDSEVPVVHVSGEVRLVHAAVTPVIVDGERVGLHGVARDITVERVTGARQRLLTGAFDDLPDAVSITDTSPRILYSNRAHAELLGYDWEAPPPDLLSLIANDEESRAQLVEIRSTLQHERRWSGRMRRTRVDGRPIVVSANIFAVSDGETDYAVTVMRDATLEIARDRHLRRVERLASVGTLIGGVAHELNNPLTAVVGFAHLMLLDERTPEDRETLETVAREAERAARIVADLRLVARTSQEEAETEREAVDLNAIVRSVLRIRKLPMETRGIEVVEELDDGLPTASANRAQIEQALMHVVVNAEHALARVKEGRRRLTVRTAASPFGVALHVSDNGPGILPQHIDRIFDPFFTTKAPGDGTGLGLSLVHTIVTEHGGELRVQSEPGNGAEFVIELPLAAASGRAPDGPPPPN